MRRARDPRADRDKWKAAQHAARVEQYGCRITGLARDHAACVVRRPRSDRRPAPADIFVLVVDRRT